MLQAKKKSLITENEKQRFKALQDRFYAKLKDEGFVDIEDATLPDRPLKQWHGLKYSSESVLNRIEIRREYQKLIDDFTNHKDFDYLCGLKPNRWNKLTKEKIKEIWNLWGQHGWTERKIAAHMKISKTNVHYFLARLRKWMMIL